MSQRDELRAIAIDAMHARGLDPDFPPGALAEVAALHASPQRSGLSTRDLRGRLWCSIDNDTSRDLDQLSVAEPSPDGGVRILVAIADVDAAVRKGSAVDEHAARNTTSVYTPAIIFPMLPEKLSSDFTSLVDQEDRLSIVVDYFVADDGDVTSSDVYSAMVRNHAKLAYNGVGPWLAGDGPLPAAAAAVSGMDEQLRIQDRVAQALDQVRHAHGALQFEGDDVEHVFEGETLRAVRAVRPNRAKSLIENLMIAANGVTARFLEGRGLPLIRRVVRSPERWDRIRALARQFGDDLPPAADSAALARFLSARRTAAPDEFVDLSRTVIKLLGSGEYVVDPPGVEPPGHFGLAVRDYTHSTAPNRRYPDVVTQRLIKAALAGRPSPYSIADLEQLAAHCTRQEDAANKVERQVRKSAVAMLVEARVGEEFDAVVTGASPKGTFVRVPSPPMEGMLLHGTRGLDVGDRVRVRLAAVNVQRGYIDFVRD